MTRKEATSLTNGSNERLMTLRTLDNNKKKNNVRASGKEKPLLDNAKEVLSPEDVVFAKQDSTSSHEEHVEIEDSQQDEAMPNETDKSQKAVGITNFPHPNVAEHFPRRTFCLDNMNQKHSSSVRRLIVPAHRLSALRKWWEEIVRPLVDHMKLLVRMNVKRRCVELKFSEKTPDVSYLQKGADFVRSFLLGFDIQDGLALLRLDDLFLESFEIKDVKRLVGDHLSRCIGRISGKEGKTKFAIENATRTRIVLADSHIHILGAFQNIKMARDSICSLILGSPTGKVYNRLRIISRRLQERL